MLTRSRFVARPVVWCVFSACLALALGAMAGCTTTTGGNTGNGGGNSGTPTATTAPTTCAQVQGFASAAAANPVNGFNYPLPTNTVQTTPQTSAGGAGQYTLYDIDLCTPNTTTELRVGATPRPLATALEFYGWGMMQSFPLAGDAQKACPNGDVCYGYQVQTKNNVPYFQIPPQFLALENVQSRGNGLVTFHLKLAGPPAAPNCSGDPNYDSLDQAIFGVHPVYQVTTGLPGNATPDGVQLPPVTRMYSDAATGHIYYQMCSAGSAASVNAFMFAQLTANGWTGCNGQPAPSAAGGCFAYTFTAQCGSQTMQISVNATSAAAWGFGYGKPCFGQ